MSREKPWSELTFSAPEYPSEFAHQVAATVESADIEDAFRIGWISTQIQTQKYRLQEFSRKISDSSSSSSQIFKRDIPTAVLHAIELNFLIQDLSSYAKGIQPMHLRIFDVSIYTSQLTHYGITEVEWPNIYKMARSNRFAEGEYRGKGKEVVRGRTG